MNNLQIVGLGLMAVALLGDRLFGGTGQGVRYYRLPSGQVVLESQLASYGFVNFGGMYVHYSKLNTHFNEQSSATDWVAYLKQVEELYHEGEDIYKDILIFMEKEGLDWWQ